MFGVGHWMLASCVLGGGWQQSEGQTLCRMQGEEVMEEGWRCYTNTQCEIAKPGLLFHVQLLQVASCCLSNTSNICESRLSLVFVLIILLVLQSVVEHWKGWEGWYLEAFSVIRPFAASKRAALLGQSLFMAVWGEKIQTPVKMKTISHLSDTAMGAQAWVHKRRRMWSNRKLLDKEEYEWRIQVGKVRGYWLRSKKCQRVKYLHFVEEWRLFP